MALFSLYSWSTALALPGDAPQLEVTATDTSGRMKQSVVALRRVTDPTGGLDGKTQGIVASGVIVGGGMVLTAGHAVEDDVRLACRGTTVDAAGYDAPAGASRDTVTSGSVKYGKGADIGLLRVDASRNLDRLPPAEPASSSARKGDRVYFVNYQIRSDGQARTPYAGKIYSAALAESLVEPARFEGIVLGMRKAGYTVAIPSRTDGASVDGLLRSGGSGGGVFNADGRLVGLSVASASLGATRTAGQLYDLYGVRLQTSRYQVVHVQAVSAAVLSELQAGLSRCE